MPFCPSLLQRPKQQLGQSVVLAPQAQADVEGPLEVPDALADGHGLVEAHLPAGGGGQKLDHRLDRWIGEVTEDEGVAEAAPILVAGHDGGLAFYLEAVGGDDVQLLDGLSQIDEVHVALVVAAADGRGGIDQGHSRHGPGVVHGHLKALYLYGQLLRPVATPHQPRALRQQVAEAPAMGDHLDQLGHTIWIAPTQLKAIRLLRPNDPLLEEIVGEGDGASRADGVQAVGVAEVAQVGHGGQVVEEKEGAQGADRLVLRPLGLGQSVFVHLHLPLAGNGAAVAGIIAGEDSLRHGRTAEICALWERTLGEVAGGRVPQHHGIIEGAGGARFAQDGGGDVLPDGVQGLAG